MRYFDLRGLLPQPDQPSAEALPVFEHVPADQAPAPVAADNPVNPTNLPDVITLMERAGVTADRRTSPNLLAQLRAAAATSRVDSVICSLLDGDAALRLNTALAARYPEDLVAGLDFLDKLLSPRRSWVVTDETAPSNWLTSIRAAAKLSRRRIVPLRNDYPESDPSLLLFTLLKRRLRPDQLPTQANAVLLDAAAAISVGHFARTGARPPYAWVAVHHPEWPTTRYADVAAGTSLSTLLAHLGLRAEDYVLRAGDLLRDRKVPPDTPLSAGELTFHVTYPERPANPDPCIRCGWCAEGCPVRIHPAGILEASQRGSLPLARHYGLDSCIECGICSYVCPSHLPILPGIRQLRHAVNS